MQDDVDIVTTIMFTETKVHVSIAPPKKSMESITTSGKRKREPLILAHQSGTKD